jgi:hypothetical protein
MTKTKNQRPKYTNETLEENSFSADFAGYGQPDTFLFPTLSDWFVGC